MLQLLIVEAVLKALPIEAAVSSRETSVYPGLTLDRVRCEKLPSGDRRFDGWQAGRAACAAITSRATLRKAAILDGVG